MPGNVRGLTERLCGSTVAEISKELGISVGNVDTITREQLEFRKISTKWGPCPCTQEKKAKFVIHTQ